MTAVRDIRLTSLDRLFKALSDPTRLRILGLLVGGEVCVSDLHDCLGIPQPRTSRHLSYLRRVRLVQTRKDGLWVHYRLAPLEDSVMKVLAAAVTHCLGHVEAIARDRQRLEARTGHRAPSAAHPVFDCCRPPRQSIVDRRRSGERRNQPRPTRA